MTAADMTDIQLDNRFPAAETLQRAYAGIAADRDRAGDAATALELLRGWDGQNDADSPGATYANVLWEHLTAAMVESVGGSGDDGPAIPRDDQGRFTLFFARQLDDPRSPWFGDDRDALLARAAADAAADLVARQGPDPEQWNWGELHALELTNGTFGESGIAPIEALFNRGPYPVGGGSSSVNATGWTLGEGYGTVTVPSMRMVVDLDDWDASTWQNLTGQSGHAFHPHYVDQVEGWASGVPDGWAWSDTAVEAAAEHRLVLFPAS